MSKTSVNPSEAGNILIVDADSMTADLLQFRLEAEGFTTKVVADGKTALELDIPSYSLIFVDLMDREFNGLMFARQLKSNPDTFSVPVIVISPKKSEDDVIDALDAGADDFISKPFSTRELIARARAMVRRRKMMSARRAAVNTVRFRDLVLDVSAGTAFIDGIALQLTRTEYLILAMFLRNRNNFFERVEIRREAWPDDASVSDRAVDTNISRLRKKLGDYASNIVNRQGFGYGFVE